MSGTQYPLLSFSQTPRLFAIWACAFHWPEIQAILPDAQQVNGRCKEWENYVAADTTRAITLAQQFGYQPGAAANLPGPNTTYYSDYWSPAWLMFELDANNDLTTFSESDMATFLRGELFSETYITATLAEIQGAAAITFDPEQTDPTIYGQNPIIIVYSEFTYALDPRGHIWFQDIPPPPLEPDGIHYQPVQEWFLGGSDSFLIVPRSIIKPLGELAIGNIDTVLTLSGGTSGGQESLAWLYAPNLETPGNPPPTYPPIEANKETLQGYKYLQQLLKTLPPALAKFNRTPYASSLPPVLRNFGFPDPVSTVFEQVAPLGPDAINALTDQQKAAMYAQRLHDFYKQLAILYPPHLKFTAPASGYNLYQKPFMSHYVDVSDLP